jgi:hypothetical protein
LRRFGHLDFGDSAALAEGIELIEHANRLPDRPVDHRGATLAAAVMGAIPMKNSHEAVVFARFKLSQE